ncbi:uncharacterized protein CANTADRAFT_52560 [Suhomyces tanzawaensis NRRL Y-17324]|uniref:dolichol kinase n=1 Tax=Suhomyces tanzawaensis NRRL Y-17324 TaxID=984487 RepID=A0A1E4SG13_9ASCO|nr:uncharacterized protein CANTADRAFT_52560 [Suhomyces tanzawaensis NRRL Y-17324]ODV78447.1 hypothetical protein CANTADRAFT_52560 [Suhomyces tanzawaensis NRRL Y-17324]
MAKKGGRRERATSPESTPGTQSMAKVFRDQTPGEEFKEQVEPVPTSPQVPLAEEEDDDIANASFPVKIIYQVQDFLNANMNFLYFVQLLVFGYLIQLSYLSYEKFEHLKDLLPIIGFNAIGVLIGLGFSYVRADAEERKKLPDFGYIYSVLLPLFVGVLHYNPDFFLVNLCLNYFIIDRLNPIFRTFSSIVFFEMYNENNTMTTFNFLQISVTHGILLYALNFINDGNLNSEVSSKKEHLEPNADYNKSLRKSEIQLITLILSNLLFNKDLVDKHVPLVILQKLVISLISSTFITYPIFSFIPGFVSMALFGGVFYWLTNYQLKALLNADNAVLWLYNYIFEDEQKLSLLKIWVGILAVVIPFVFYNVDRFSLNSRRKIWHLVIVGVLCVSPKVLIEEVEFTLICMLGSIILFVVVEIVRFNQLTFIGKFLFDRLVKFQDFKDLKGPLNLSYIYLLVGISIPIVYDYTSGQLSLIRYMGLVGLGLGDALASVVGKRFGSIKWKGNDKSVQGSVAFVVVTFGSFVVIDTFLSGLTSLYVPVNNNWENLFVSVLIAALLEGSSDLNDNFFVPIILPIAYEVLNMCFKH